MSHDEHDHSSGITLECPQCGAEVGYGETVVVEGDEDVTGCPYCGQASPTDDWFE